MAPRPFWKGYLKLSLVTCPVAMSPATSEGAKVRFHTLNRATGNRVVSRYVDAETGKPVAEDNEVKGYETTEGEHVLLEDEELDTVRLESTRTIDIERFVEAGSIGWIWYDKPHYLMPDDKVGEEAFCVIRDAMAASGTAGISRLVIYGRERAVLLKPCGKGMVLWTLHFGNEVRPEDDYFGAIAEEAPSKSSLALMGRLIKEREAPWSPALVEDPVQERLLELIASKKSKARKAPRMPAKAAAPPPADNVVDIMEALRRSLAAEKAPRRR